MRRERLVTLQLTQEPLADETGARIADGVLTYGDEPDWTLAVRVYLVPRARAARVLERAKELLATPVTGLAVVADLGWMEDEAYVAYRAGTCTRLRDLPLSRIAPALQRLKLALPKIPQHGRLCIDNIFIGADDEPLIFGWAEGPGSAGEPDVRALERLGQQLLAAPELHDSSPSLGHSATISFPPGAPPRALGFDAALGAALSGVDEADDPAVSVAEAISLPRPTRALPQLAWPVVTAPSRVPSASRPGPSAQGSRSGRSIALFLVVLGAGIVAGAVALRTREASVVTQQPIAVRPTTASTPQQPIADVAPRAVHPVLTLQPAPHRSVPSPLAILDVATDVRSTVKIDGKLFGETPLHTKLSAGSHRVRIEAVDGPMRLLPHEELITLAPAERRTLHVELR